MMATIGQALTTPEVGWKRYDDKSASFKYSGTFTTVANADRYMGASIYSTNKSANIKFSFSGTKIRIIHSMGSDRKPTIVKIDGVEESYSAYNTNLGSGQYLVYEKVGLQDGNHTVEVFHSLEAIDGTTPLAWDAIDIDSTGRLFHPDEVTSIADLISVGQHIRAHYRNGQSGSVGNFTNLGKETKDFIPVTSAAMSNGDFYFILAEDVNGKKKLVADRNVQNAVSWDKLNSVGFTHGVPLKHDLESSLMGWYTFNDTGATVFNSAGGDFGALTGTTRTPGWNGIGTALKFNGTSDYAVLQHNLSGGPVSIRLKLKKDGNPTTYQYFFTTLNALATQTGMTMETGNGDGKIYVSFANNGSYMTLVSTMSVCDNQWHDICFTWDGKAGSEAKLYIDDMTTPNAVTIPTKSNDITHTQTSVILGRLNGLASGWWSGELDEVEIYNSEINPATTEPKRASSAGAFLGQEYVSSMLSGGLSSTDKDNEWDKIMAESTLNGLIVAGNNSIWNWSGQYSWTTTTYISGSGSRVVRGNTSVSTWNYAASNAVVATSTGYRPVLEIIETFIEKNKYLIQDGTNIYSLANGNLAIIGQVPVTQDMFVADGLDTLSGFTSDIFATLVNPTILYYRNQIDANTRTLNIGFVPQPRTVLSTGDLDISKASNIDSFTVLATESGAGKVRMAASFDSGVTWKSYDSVNSVPVTIDITNIGTAGMDLTTFNSLGVIWNSMRGAGNTVRFAYYLEHNAPGDIASVDSLEMQADFTGMWRKAIHGTDYDYVYTNNKTLQVEFLRDGTYKVNYIG